MKKVIFDLIRDGAMVVYPDDRHHFFDTDTNTVPGKVIASYTGEQALELYEPAPVVDPRPEILITGISGADFVTPDVSFFEATENAEVTFTGTLLIPDSARPFAMPIIRQDTGRVIFAMATVTSGQLTAVVRFPMSGLWETNDVLINKYRPPTQHLRFAGVKGVVVV